VAATTAEKAPGQRMDRRHDVGIGAAAPLISSRIASALLALPSAIKPAAESMGVVLPQTVEHAPIRPDDSASQVDKSVA
jgi:hypothetical protein